VAGVSGRAVAGGSAVGFSAGWNIADTGAVADDLADAYGTSLGVIGLLTAVLFLVHMLMQLPAGRLSDRLGPARVCAGGLAVMALGNVLAGLAPEPALALGARALLGVNEGVTKLRGRRFTYVTQDGASIPAMVMFHPAYLLRQPAQKRLAWRDLLAIRSQLDAVHRA